MDQKARVREDQDRGCTPGGHTHFSAPPPPPLPSPPPLSQERGTPPACLEKEKHQVSEVVRDGWMKKSHYIDLLSDFEIEGV